MVWYKQNRLYKRTARFIKGIRRRKLKDQEFSIISNNCWGGVVSHYYGLKNNSPTIGLYFWAPDYIRFVYNLRWYISQPLKIIPTTESKYYDHLVERGGINDVIGKLGDIEIVFMHYKTPEEALEKWNRRCRRINWDRLFIKFSEMNLCTEKELQLFDKLPFENKIMFTRVPRPDLRCAVCYPGYENEKQIIKDTNPPDKCMDITAFLNAPDCEYSVSETVG